MEKAKNECVVSQSELVDGAPASADRVEELAQVPVSGSEPLPPKVPQVEELEADGPEAGCRVRWEGRTVEVKGRSYKFINFMWRKEWAGFDAIKNGVAQVADSTIHTWRNRANNDLVELSLTWKPATDGRNRIVRKESR